MSLFCLLPGCRLLRVVRDGPDRLIVSAKGRRDHARCPDCRTTSTAVHARYRRRAADLPVSGQVVRLDLTVRRFSCGHPGCSRRTFADHFPRHSLRGPERSILDPYLDHLHVRLGAGCENAMQLWRELRALGFPGTPKQVGRWLGERRTRPARTTVRRWQSVPVAAPASPLPPPPLPSPKQLSWCLLHEPENIEGTVAVHAAAHIARVLQDGEAAKVVDLARRFCRIVRSRCGTEQVHADAGAAFDAWLDKARRCGIGVVEGFAASLDADGAAVRAGLRLPWSSGQLEGQVNRLKLLKRSMYGRAKLDLLRRRFLLAS